MGNIYDGAFRTILNDCRQMIIPIINEIFKEDYTGNEINTGANLFLSYRFAPVLYRYPLSTVYV